VSDTVVLVLTALLALSVLGCTLRGIWHISRHAPTRQRAVSYLLGSIAGTALLGVVLPAVLIGALDPFPIWLVYAAITIGASIVLGWRWQALEPGKGSHPGLVVTSFVLLVVLAMAGVAVT
jgi:hypothetical protein